MKNIWDKKYKKPWDENEFSERMLTFHLSEEHDMASRRTKKIDQHIRFIHENILNKKKSNILDICCGPGLYLNKLAEFGHTGKGYDFSPASIDYANKNKKDEVFFYKKDILNCDFDDIYDLCIFVYGEFNVFAPEKIISTLKKIYNSLKSNSKIIVEIQKFDYVKKMSEINQKKEYIQNGLLFSNKAYYQTISSVWDNINNATIQTYYIEQNNIDKEYKTVTKAYKKHEINEMFESIGFENVIFSETFGEDKLDYFWLVTALKN